MDIEIDSKDVKETNLNNNDLERKDWTNAIDNNNKNLTNAMEQSYFPYNIEQDYMRQERPFGFGHHGGFGHFGGPFQGTGFIGPFATGLIGGLAAGALFDGYGGYPYYGGYYPYQPYYGGYGNPYYRGYAY